MNVNFHKQPKLTLDNLARQLTAIEITDRPKVSSYFKEILKLRIETLNQEDTFNTYN